MKTTITDVAKLAGVSMKTVSRVLNNEPNVAKATRDRVMKAASELQYTPNLAARGLASSRSYLIALIYDNPSPNYISNLQRGAVEACRNHGYHLVLAPITAEEAGRPDVEHELRRLGVDAVVLAPPLSASKPLLNALDKLGLPYAVVAPAFPTSGPSVRIDDVEAARVMTHHLIDLGHRDIAFILGPSTHASTGKREKGFRKAMQEANIDLPESRILTGNFTVQSGADAVREMLRHPETRPTAIFALNDDMAAGVMRVAARFGIAMPGQLSVCGFDDTPIAQAVWPKLTTVSHPIKDMGCLAVKKLIGKSPTEETASDLLDFELVIRDSTAPPETL
jgi:LacI family transcriptional regulator